MQVELTNEQMFRLLCAEIIELEGRYISYMKILSDMNDPDFIDYCECTLFAKAENYTQKYFLLEWLKAKHWDIHELRTVAVHLDGLLMSNERMFKLLCMEIIESMGRYFMSPMRILFEMSDSSFIDQCERMIFIDDDNQLDAQEQFLLDWMTANKENQDLIPELMPVAERLQWQL
jgi:hypothetical protein